MKVSLNNLASLYLTGSLKPDTALDQEAEQSMSLTDQELDDMEMNRNEYEESENQCTKFNSSILNKKANLNTVSGQFRLSGLGAINSFFSGIGTGFGSKINFLSGFGLAGASLGAAYFKNLPLLSKKHSIFGFGWSLIRGPLHIFDSIFSLIGEHGSKYTLPSIFAGAVSLFSINRTLNNKDNKSFELPVDTIGGTLGRTAIHHMDSMLASKAAQIFNSNQSFGSFLASGLTTAGLLLPEESRKKQLPWNTFEGFVSQGSSHFIDSLFSSIGNVFSSSFDSTKKIILGSLGVLAGMPALGTLLNKNNYKVPFGTLEGRLVRGIFHAPESLVFNIGRGIGNSIFGIPMSIGFAALTYFTCLSNKGKNIIKNVDISRDKIGGLLQRLPFHFLYSIISTSGVKLSKLIPSPLLLAIGPALSYKLGERFKNVDSKFDDLKGLMLRNTVHLWETTLARAAYNTGRMLTGTEDEHNSSGSVLGDGRWLSDDGQILPTMAIGKQINETDNQSILNTLLSGLGGIGIAIAAVMGGKHLLQRNKAQVVEKPNIQLDSLNDFNTEIKHILPLESNQDRFNGQIKIWKESQKWQYNQSR